MTGIKIQLPISESDISRLKAGDSVLLSGPLLSGRDAAHKRFISALKEGKPLPVDLRGETIYYVGPCPTPPGRVIGSAGPTTSGRMDSYTPELLRLGLKGMIGKGQRSPEVINAIKQFSAVYFAALGGAGALIARSIQNATVMAYQDLGPEAVYRLEVVDFPVIVAIDANGNDLYALGRGEYAKTGSRAEIDMN
jgi:fumarate hydratase subunit beta